MKIPLEEAVRMFNRNSQPIEHSRRLLKSYISSRELRVYANSGYVGIHSPKSIDDGLPPTINERDSWSFDDREINGIELLISLDPKIEWKKSRIEIDIVDTREIISIQRGWRGEYISFVFEGVCLDEEEVEACAMFSTATTDMAPKGGKRVGRPREYDWEGALISLIVRANHPDGLPDRGQAGIEKLIRDHLDPDATGSPAESTIRTRASRVMTALKGRK
ncbi:hypothetical protein [Ancylobacter sp. SL191]|uniref:hypothetical protein n=1 Tax=Ancylobacter sp. SL191 TaxID=2995166 RepID=UPI00226DA5BD|nr:hypothetical protein [Ancylobacter sp. SL191]WAC27853.1 hypothetical protein OU996_01875 [Ancylobacter sp. SL191]